MKAARKAVRKEQKITKNRTQVSEQFRTPAITYLLVHSNEGERGREGGKTCVCQPDDNETDSPGIPAEPRHPWFPTASCRPQLRQANVVNNAMHGTKCEVQGTGHRWRTGPGRGAGV